MTRLVSSALYFFWISNTCVIASSSLTASTTETLSQQALDLARSSPDQLDQAGGLLNKAYTLIPADDNATEVAHFTEALAEFGSLRVNVTTSSLNFTTATTEGLIDHDDAPSMPFFVPYFICTNDFLPFFYYDYDCDREDNPRKGEVMPVVKTIYIKPKQRNDDQKWLFHLSNGDIDSLCVDHFGQWSQELLHVCRFHLGKLMGRELESHSMEGSGGTHLWVGGHENVEKRYSILLSGLDRITIEELKSSSESGQEGNIWHTNGWNNETVVDVWKDDGHDYDDNSEEVKWLTPEMLENKRRCLNIVMAMSLTKAEASVLEIGFNSGHSATMFLTLFPRLSMVSFDLCAHVYTDAAIKKLIEMFGKRIELRCGNSHTTLPAYRNEWVEKARDRFDATFIDGGHYYEDTWLDLLFSVNLLKKGSTIIVDDCTTNIFEKKGVSKNKSLGDFNVYEM